MLKGSREQEEISRASGSSPRKEGLAVGTCTVLTRAPRHCFLSLTSSLSRLTIFKQQC